LLAALVDAQLKLPVLVSIDDASVGAEAAGPLSCTYPDVGFRILGAYIREGSGACGQQFSRCW
jgi:hypothetical protein